MNINRYSLVILGIIFFTLFLSGCQKADKKPALPKISRVPVVLQTPEESKHFKQTIKLPGFITSKQEAKILSKVSGTAEAVFFGLGQKVSLGDKLIKIDEVSGTSYGTGFNTGSINQAKLSSEQAAALYKSAQLNYQNLLQSTSKDLEQTSIALSQAKTGTAATETSTVNALKTAQIALKTAQIASAQAQLALDSRMVLADQAMADAHTNAALTVVSVTDGLKTLITAINNLTGFDESNTVNVFYEDYLGALDHRQLNDAKNLYKKSKDLYADFLANPPVSDLESVDRVLLLTTQIKSLVDAVKAVFENTISGASLPQDFFGGPSLSTLQATITGYQAQINGYLAQIQAADQTLKNVALGNESILDALKKAYELAQQQEKSAAQNLSSLEANSKNQVDQARLSEDQAVNLYENTEIKLNSQLVSAKAQLDSAQFQYQNSLVTLSELTGNYQLLSPISGVITQKLISDGETVSPGQLLFVVGQPEQMKIQFYVDETTLPFLKVGMPLFFEDKTDISVPGRITALGSTADPATKRFLVEAEPTQPHPFTSGTLTQVVLSIDVVPLNSANFLLPLSAIEISQNGSTVFISEKDRAKQVPVTLVQIKGESAELIANFPIDSKIVVEGNKLLNEGDYLTNQAK